MAFLRLIRPALKLGFGVSVQTRGAPALHKACKARSSPFGAAHSYSTTMSALQHSRIVPDVIDAVDVDEEVEMGVTYPTGFAVANGNDISKDKAQEPPKVEVVGAKGRHTLIMSDPDAPSPDDPKFREFLHWLIVNIPDGDISKGQELVPFMGPKPPVGKHRYIFMLWRQAPPSKLDEIAKEVIDHTVEAAPPADRKNFSTRAFAKEHRLRGPVAVRFFYSEP